MKTILFNNQLSEQGQTLIETMVAALVLVMGISAAVALAVYGLGATTSVTKQLIAVGLAREGLEGVKNMRDTNWLQGDLEGDCFDFYTQLDGGFCYQDWLNATGGYDIDPSGIGTSATYTLGFNSTSADNEYWVLNQESGLAFGLDYNPQTLEDGYYNTSGNTVSKSNSGFGRKITITAEDQMDAFNTNLGPRLKVSVDVWWTDKRCPVSDDVPTNSNCKITLETYLTNWKDY